MQQNSRFANLQHAVRRRGLLLLRKRMHAEIVPCAAEGCRQFTVAHRMLRQDGIYIEDAQGLARPWLCSPACLQASLTQLYLRPARGTSLTMPRLPRMPYRLALLRQGAVSEDALRTAVELAQKNDVPLSFALLATDAVSEEHLAAALAVEAGCAFYALAHQLVDCSVALPSALAERYMAATVHATPERIVIGFVHRIHRELLATVEAITGRRVEGCFITPTYRERQLVLQARGHFLRATGKVTAACDAAAETVACALRIGAESIRVRRCGEHLWIRCMRSETAFEDCIARVLTEPVDAGRGREQGMGRKIEKKAQAL